jgi:flap endonuclease-1
MGVQLKDILEFQTISISKLQNKKIAIDTFNMLYQFLSSIRGPDGDPLKDSNGNITSHLKGLFNRCVYFKKNNIKAVFIFDGKAPKLKEKTRELRKEAKIKADEKYREALDLGLMEDASKYARGTSKLEDYMIEDSKKLISFFGFPIVQAPSEGEAQAAYLSKKGLVFASSSQDFDSLLFGASYLIRNFSVSQKRKIPGSSIYKETEIEFYDLKKNLENLGLNQDELIILAILCGTDFNPGGIKGIGPKKALKLVKEYRDRWEDLFKIIDWYDYFTYSWIEVYNVFKNMPVLEDINLKFDSLNKEGLISFLKEKDFDEEQVLKSLKTIKSIKTLDNFFGEN